MTLVNKLQSVMQAAMKSGDSDRVRTLRTVLAKLKEREIERGGELSERELTKVLQTAAKQRKEAADMYSNGGRTELADAELKELAIIEEYLPKQLSEEQVALMIDAAIEETGAESLSDIGKVMPVIMNKAAGSADGKTIQELVRRKLAG